MPTCSLHCWKIIANKYAAAGWLGVNANGFDELKTHLDLIDMPRSTLNSYLEKLVMLITGNFDVPGGMNLHTRFASLGSGASKKPGSGSGGREPTTPATGHRLVTGLVPCNVIPEEIIGDHPDRFWAMLIESGNPVHSLADSKAMREALRQLDFVCVIDVAMTETAREADYVLPGASQFEKWECTFFNLEFPHNYFHLRQPVFEPLVGTLPECEIHSRLCRALGAYDDDTLAPLHAATADGRAAYTGALVQFMVNQPADARNTRGSGRSRRSRRVGPRSAGCGLLGRARRAEIGDPEGGDALGDVLFDHILANPSGITFSSDDYDETMRRLLTPDGKVNLLIPALLDELDALADEPAPRVATMRSPSFSPPVSDVRPRPTPCSAIRRGASRTNRAHCACHLPMPSTSA